METYEKHPFYFEGTLFLKFRECETYYQDLGVHD